MYKALLVLLLIASQSLWGLEQFSQPAQSSSQISDEQSFEPGKVVFKIQADHKLQLKLSSSGTGISAIDNKLQAIGGFSLQPRWQTSKNKSRTTLPDLSGIIELSFDPSIHPSAVINQLKQLPEIEYAEPIYIDTIFDAPDDPRYPSSLYFSSLQAEDAWDIHKGEDGTQPVILAVVDTGVNWKHADLVQNIWQNLAEDANSNGYTIYYNGSAWVYDAGDLNGIDDDGNGKIDDLIGWDFMLDASGAQHYDPYQSSGHGTSVSGIANARTNNTVGVASVAWNVTLMPISCSYTGSSSIFRGYDAIIYAAENGADVINCSWGGSTFSQANQDAIDYAYALGSLIVAAAGNSNNSTPIYPAAYQNVVATAALNNDGTKSSVSSFGGFVSVGAPTQAVDTTSGSGYAQVGGPTSYASPIASSLAALIKSYNPTWTNAQVANQLVATCDNIDLLNPGKENMLGQGKLNAYRALSEIAPLPDQELKVALHQLRTPNDANSNRAIEAGETFSLNLTLRNYSYGASSANVNYILSSSDPMVSILDNSYSGSMDADSYVYLDDVFSVLVSPTATSKYVSFSLSVSADIPVVIGSTLTFQVLINAGGVFVWEGKASGRDMSGNYIRSRLIALGHQTTYGTVFPASFLTFDAVFLSFGMVGSNITRFNTNDMYVAVKEYLEGGGKLYIEGCDVVGFDLATYLPDVEGALDAHEVLWPMLGISDAEDGTSNPIDGLSGDEGWITYPMNFSASNQTVSDYIDVFEPASGAYPAWIESGYGIVGVEYTGSFGQRTFVSSYPLAELVDGVAPHTRSELVNRIITFFLDPDPQMPEILVITPAQELVYPLFMQGESTGGVNNNRLPDAMRIKLSGLQPDATYRYIHQAVMADDSPLKGGYGNPLFISESGNFTRVSSPDLSIPGQYGELTANGSGEYTGWFGLEPTGDSHFSSGNDLYLRFRLNDGNSGIKPVNFQTTSNSFQTLGLGEENETWLGTAIYGYSGAEPKSFVFLYDNPAGLGRPVSGSHIETCGIDFDLPEYPDFYRNDIHGSDGAWAGIIPNSYSSKDFDGIMRIEARSLNTGEVTAFNTDDDGIWPSGANSVNPSGGASSPILIQMGDATLPVQLSSFLATALADGRIQLKWISESEHELSGYYVYRSIYSDPQTAVQISWLIPAGNTSQQQIYTYSDEGVASTGQYYYWLECIGYDGSSGFFGPALVMVEEIIEQETSPEVPVRTDLLNVFPNPFNPLLNISFTLAETKPVTILIYNSKGQLVRTMPLGTKASGFHLAMFDGRDNKGQYCASGIYHVILKASEQSFRKKALLMK